VSDSIKTCPFCGDTPWFEGDAADWQDDCRYVQLTLKCCVTMTAAIGWKRAREITVEARTTEMQSNLIDRWNARYDTAALAAPQPVQSPLPDHADFAEKHKFLEWNRAQPEPLVKIAHEYYVFEQAMKISKGAKL
jgi:hypothetical protein